jgi:hypothetical protein
MLTMLLLLHHFKHLTPIERPLGLTFMLTKLFGFEDLMIVVAKKWREGGIMGVNCK